MNQLIFETRRLLDDSCRAGIDCRVQRQIFVEEVLRGQSYKVLDFELERHGITGLKVIPPRYRSE